MTRIIKGTAYEGEWIASAFLFESAAGSYPMVGDAQEWDLRVYRNNLRTPVYELLAQAPSVAMYTSLQYDGYDPRGYNFRHIVAPSPSTFETKGGDRIRMVYVVTLTGLGPATLISEVAISSIGSAT